MIEVTDEMLVAFETAEGSPDITCGDTRAGLAAVLAIIERDNDVRPRPWCGAARQLGGQQPCPLKVPCGPAECAIGRAAGGETYAPEVAS